MITSRPLVTAAIFAALALVGLAGCGLGSERFSSNEQRTIPLAHPIDLSISEPAGRIAIVAWDRPTLQIDAEKRASSQADLARMHVDIAQHADAVAIETQYQGVGFGAGGVEYVVHLPASSNLDVHTAAGQIVITGMRGNVRADTAAGQVKVRMAAAGGSQRITLAATTGQVTLALPHDANATIDASATIGSVRNTAGGTHLGDGSAQIRLRTTTGEVRITRAS